MSSLQVLLKGFLSDIDPASVTYPPLRPLNVTAHLEQAERYFEDDALFRGGESFVFNDDGRCVLGKSVESAVERECRGGDG